MKTETNGGAAETQVTQKLARLYEVELDRAERDFPTMRVPALEAGERAPRPRLKLRLFSEAVAIVAHEADRTDFADAEHGEQGDARPDGRDERQRGDHQAEAREERQYH